MLLEDFQKETGIGYRIVSNQDGTLVSLAGSDKVDPTIGSTTSVGGAGLYLGTSKDFVMNYYSGLTDYDDVLLTYKYDMDDVLSGNPDDSDGEITVRRATLVDIEEV
jgi:hypothetical protein